MALFLYRINGGKVLGISTDPAAYSNIDTSFFATIDNPSVPDGEDLTIAKIWDVTQVRNATSAEIAAFVTAESQDQVSTDRMQAKASINSLPITKKYLQAIVSLLLDEINTLRALHSLTDRTIAQAKTAIDNKIDSGNFD